MKKTIQLITTDGSVLFEHTQQDNSITKTLNEFINVQNYKDLSNIDLSNQNLEGLSFENMDLIGANFKSANLKNVTFNCADLSQANFSNARLTNSSFRFTYLDTANFKEANLCDCVLIRANLSRAKLIKAKLSGANLSGADLNGANLSKAKLIKANLRWADLSGADLNGADLSWADLSRAHLSKADLRKTDLRETNLYAANLRQTKLDGVMINGGTQFFAFQCPSEGSFIGWKKTGITIIKLLIPEDAQRSSATSLKCRCSKAEVLDIQNLDGSKHYFSRVQSDYDSNFIYEVGKTVEVSNFDENRWEECSSGIHFFMSREVAVNY